MTRPPSRRWSRSSNRRPDRSPRGRYTAFRVTVRDPDDHLTRDNAIGRSTGYEYPHEGIDVLAARAPGLHGALLGRICGGRAGSGSRPPRSPTRPGPRPRACRRPGVPHKGQLATASPQHHLLIRRHLKTGELAFHYRFVPEGHRSGSTPRSPASGGQACALRPGSEGARTRPAGRPRGDRLPVPHGGTCRGIPPLRREPYAGLRRVSHDPCPERSRRPGRRVLARRLRARADRRGARGHRPGRSQDDHQRTELRREDRRGRLRGQQHGDVRQPGHRAA
jgi:hypothetical protein